MPNRVVGFVLLDHDGRVLLQLRDDKPNIPYPNHWVFPGGTVDGDEEPQDCVLREIHEEFGVEVHPDHLAFIGGYTRGDGVEAHIFLCNGDEVFPEAITEGQRAAYFTLKEIVGMKLGFEQKKYLFPLLLKYVFRRGLRK